jgi:N-acetylneuraminic acid mutarotase
MKSRSLLLLLVLCPLCFGTAATPPPELTTSSAKQEAGLAWSTRAPMLQASRGVLFPAEMDGRIYVARSTDGLFEIDEYDPKSNRWTHKPGRSQVVDKGTPAVAAVDGKVFLIGGYLNGKTLSSVEAYDVKTETWSRCADLPLARDTHAAVTLNGKIYVVGGRADDATGYEALEYDPRMNRWSVKAKGSVLLVETSAVAMGGKIYAGAGVMLPKGAMEVYDPVADRWTRCADTLGERGSFSLGAANGKIYAIGGCQYSFGNVGHIVRTVEEYDPATNRWTVAGGRPGENWLMGSISIDGRIYLFGGCVGEFPSGIWVDTVQVYDPAVRMSEPVATSK